VEDAQTHDLPTTDESRARIALAMGCADWASLLPVLEQHRVVVDRHFREVFSDPRDGENAAAHSRETEIWLAEVGEQQAVQILQEIGFEDAEQTLRRINSLHQGLRYKQLPELSRHRYDALMPVVIAQSARQPNPDATLMRVGDLLE